MGKKMKNNYTIDELLNLENATRILCCKYEKSVRPDYGLVLNSEEYALFKKYNDFHNKIMSLIEGSIDEEIEKCAD